MQTDDKWNFDPEDCAHILRVETWSVSPSTIMDELKKMGYVCEELEDIISLPSNFISFNENNPVPATQVMSGY